MLRNLVLVGMLCVALAACAYAILRGGQLYGPFILAMTPIPLGTAMMVRLDLKRLLPDVIFGIMDTGPLTLAALVGATSFGIAGAIIGSVIGDAITDGIAGFFEGSIAEWLRSHGIEESRTALGSACGKMAGCLLGSGAVLSVAWGLGLGPAAVVVSS